MAKVASNNKDGALQQTLLEYQAILENASVGILFTRDRQVVHCNPRFGEIYGWSPAELVGQSGAIFYLSPADYEDMGRQAGPILASGQLLDLEIPMRRKDGSAVLCRVRAKAIDPADNHAGTIWIIEDVTAQRAEQARLAELLQRQRAILENASVGILFTREGRIVHCNPRMEAIYGWAPGSLIGQSARVFFDSDADYRAFGAAVGPVLARGELVDIEWQHQRHRDGVRIWSRHLAKALPNSDGSQGAIWISEDISAQKDAQEALAQAHHELERRVEERTEELARINRQLQHEVAERRAAEEHLRAEEARFRDLTEMTSDWFWEMGPDLRFSQMSMGLHETKLPPDRTLGKFRWELPILNVTPAQWDEHRRILDARLPFKDFAYQMETRPGEVHWFSISGKPIIEDGVFKGYRGTGTDITAKHEAEQKIQFLAYHDPLTGLPNRVLLEDRLAQAIAQAERSHHGLALVFMDLDNFKKINDSLGHAAGDALLKEVATRLKRCVRDTDTISRQGGDEFVLVLGGLNGAEGSLPVLTKIMESLQEPFVCEGNELSTSASMGVALYPQDGDTFDILRKKADMAMYRAKEAGRNTYRFFDEAMDEEAVEHLLMRSGLRRAIERGEFVLHYQPQIDIASGRVVGVEALLRWEHPEFGLVAPGRFIPVAEDSGLIVPIGAWVIEEACRQAMAWRRAGLPDLVMAVNLSAAQFRRSGIEDTVAQALQRSGLVPALLELELTESILLQDVEQVLATVQRLKQLGVQLAIDDFGTGYSSLSYLKRFDIDKLKIDQSFIRDLASDPDDAAIVRAIIQMAHSLGLRAIAEGVETAELLQQLRGFGCDEAQGYHYARPMPAAEAERYLVQLTAPLP
ncbi:MAG: EAL domain-containing protein [Hylemonella sp.]|uniref:sensor domain-containing protein n=1 Tax=Hylemonella sp. TaxID=2066020 RepID=UPI0022BB9123|nr:bifunctional diguanylate cyclase/phosphodiesterase [Hylemonella sp.]MCZ8251429.1 EAL domain-containing protein [Hylemonella sp.]